MAAKTKTKTKTSAATSSARAQQKLRVIASPGGDDGDSTFDRLIYERVRLGIMSALAVREELAFSELKALFDVSDGNLSAHARKLEEAKYISCSKTFEDRRPKTVYRITAAGKAALHRYLDHVEAVIKATRGT
jgi:DNA-binding MarR family transcriptional regulator